MRPWPKMDHMASRRWPLTMTATHKALRRCFACFSCFKSWRCCACSKYSEYLSCCSSTESSQQTLSTSTARDPETVEMLQNAENTEKVENVENVESANHDDTLVLWPKPASYHRAVGLYSVQYAVPTLTMKSEQNERTPLKGAYDRDLDRLSQEIYYGLFGDTFCSVFCGNNMSAALVIGSVIVLHIPTVFVLWTLPELIWQRRLVDDLWIFGALYVPMQCLLFLFYPLFGGRCHGMHPVYGLIMGLIVIAMLVASIPLMYHWYTLCVVLSIMGVMMAMVMAAATELIEMVVLKSPKCKHKKPVLGILTVATRIGFVIGSLIGGQAADYFHLENVYLMMAAMPMVFSPMLIYLLRESHHTHSVLTQRDDIESRSGRQNGGGRSQLTSKQRIVFVT